MDGTELAVKWATSTGNNSILAPGHVGQLGTMIDTALAAARAEEREALRCCIEFTRLALERWEETECMMDGADVQEVLQQSGVLVETTYDPAIHGEQDAEPGDPWLVFSPAWNAIRARTQP